MANGKGMVRSIEPWEKIYGVPYPLGATLVEGLSAYNFALYSRKATKVTILLFKEEDPVRPVLTVRLDSLNNKTGRIWHYMLPVADAKGASLYGYPWRVRSILLPATASTQTRFCWILTPLRCTFPRRSVALRPGVRGRTMAGPPWASSHRGQRPLSGSAIVVLDMGMTLLSMNCTSKASRRAPTRV